MDVFCTLAINSSSQNSLPSGLFLAKANTRIEFTDNDRPERKAQRERWRKGGIPIRRDLPRYWWQICSDEFVSSDDINAHLIWILGHLRKDRLLSDLKSDGYSYLFSVFWGASNGTGGGPLITTDLAKLLVIHNAELAIGFYVK